jgi:hypothetical protein
VVRITSMAIPPILRTQWHIKHQEQLILFEFLRREKRLQRQVQAAKPPPVFIPFEFQQNFLDVAVIKNEAKENNNGGTELTKEIPNHPERWPGIELKEGSDS